MDTRNKECPECRISEYLAASAEEAALEYMNQRNAAESELEEKAHAVMEWIRDNLSLFSGDEGDALDKLLKIIGYQWDDISGVDAAEAQLQQYIA